MTTVGFASAKGGQSCSTIAATYALTRRNKLGQACHTLLVDASPGQDMHCLLGIPRPTLALTHVTDGLHLAYASPDLEVGTYYDEIVYDFGTNPIPSNIGVKVLVTKLCYLSLAKAATRQQEQYDWVIVVKEPGRALTAKDVTTALGIKLLCEIDTDPNVSRMIDAGLITSRIPQSLRGLFDGSRLCDAEEEATWVDDPEDEESYT